MLLPVVSARGVRRLVDSIHEAVDAPDAPSTSKGAVVRVEVTGDPKAVHKAIRQLARQGGLKTKVTSGPKSASEEPKSSPAPSKPKSPPAAPKKKDDEPKKGPDEAKKQDALESMVDDLLDADD